MKENALSGVHLSFQTSGFQDDADSRAQRINDSVGGHALATWLSDEVRSAGLEASDPWVEDHGWDFSVSADGAKYLCVCSIEDSEAPTRDAHVSIDKHRSFLDRLRGRGKASRDDRVIAAIRAAILRIAGADNLQESWVA
jgi:flagellar basal body rod protein FlgF